MPAQLHNAPSAKKAKIEMRMRVLDAVRPARVFDAFCGRGEMHRAVWRMAETYVGCDLSWSTEDSRRRFVADNRRVLRAVDLSEYNVFDFDAFGSPWEQMLILAARRRWAPGERGAVVLTDGSSQRSRYGHAPRALAQQAGTRIDVLPPALATTNALTALAIARWCRSAGVTPLHHWRAEGKPPSRVLYTALVFEGNKAS